MPSECAADTIKEGDSFLDEAIGILLFFILQLILLCHSLHHECKHRHNERFQKQRRLRNLFLSLQIVAIYLLINEFFKLFDSFTFIVRNTPFCVIIPYCTKTLPAVFYAVYLQLILLRLHRSFAGSHLALSRWTLLLIQSIIILIPSIVCILILIDSAGSSLQCLRSWYPMDVSLKLTYCDIPWSRLTLLGEYGLYILLTLANVTNLSMAIIFTVKLKKITAQNTNEKIDFEFRSLIVKNTILALVGSASSFLGYLLYAGTGLASFIYLDSLMNCLVIGLMFYVNEWWYKKLCTLCISCCFRKEREVKTRVLGMSQVDSVSKTTGNHLRPMSLSPSSGQQLSTLSPSVLVPSITVRSTSVLPSASTMRSTTHLSSPVTPDEVPSDSEWGSPEI